MGRDKSNGSLAQTFDWFWAPLDSRAPIRTGAFDLRDFRSAANGERISLGSWTDSGVLFTENGMVWLLPISPLSGRVTGPPRLLASGAGFYSYPSMSSDGQVVFAMTETERVIERLPLTGSAPASLPIRLYADGQDRAFRVSQTRDGNTIVFERASGQKHEIWQKNIQRAEQQIVIPVKSHGQVNPTVSQDGTRIVFTVIDDREQARTVSGVGYVVETSGGVPKLVCEHCGLQGFLSDNRRVLATADDLRIQLLDVIGGAAQDVITSSRGRLDRPTLSPNEKWIAFRRFDGLAGKIFVGPFTSGPPLSADSAQEVDEPTTTGRPCGWSPDSTVLYLLLDTDGSRDLWGQRMDTASGRLAGSPYLVRHLHGSALLGYNTGQGNATSASGFLYESVSETASIWRLVQSKKNR